MEDKDLRKLNRAQILELFLEQCRRNEALEAELTEVKAQLESKNLKIENAGSIAEASLSLTKVFEEAQKAADLYLANVKRIAGVEEETKTDAAEEQAPEAAAGDEAEAQGE